MMMFNCCHPATKKMLDIFTLRRIFHTCVYFLLLWYGFILRSILHVDCIEVYIWCGFILRFILMWCYIEMCLLRRFSYSVLIHVWFKHARL